MSSNSEEEDTRGPLERAYDEDISPLMDQVIALVQKHKINMVMSFQLDDSGDGTGPLLCSTHIIAPDGDDRLKRASNIIYPPRRTPLDITTRDKDGNILSMTRIL